MNKSRIYVVNDAGHDFSNAFDCTGLSKDKAQINLTQDSQDIFDTDRLIHEIRDRLKDSAKIDYILLSGSSILNVISVVIQLLKFKEANILLYNARARKYVVRTITLQKMGGK